MQLKRFVPRFRTVCLLGLLSLLVAGIGLGVRHYFRYSVAPEMALAVRELSNAEYPEDPAERSLRHGQYNGRSLRLVQKTKTVFDFVFEPVQEHVARVTFRDVDVALMTPALPRWTKEDPALTRISLTDRQWNRQQVRFDPKAAHLEVSGGNGFEKANLISAELAKNGLNAGLWEVLLYVQEDGQQKLYYQGWFTFPLGYFKELFEQNTGLSYWRHWHYLEHWLDPEGTPLALETLRGVKQEREVPVRFDPREPVIASGEQVRKRRTMLAANVLTWGDYYDGRPVRFASFVAPGRYDVRSPWRNRYRLLAHAVDKAILRRILSADSRELHELELTFTDEQTETPARFIVSGFDLADLPQLPTEQYPAGLYMPMGIGVPPFFQDYEALQKTPPERTPYFCVLLDADGRWLNHHEIAIDGPVLHRDAADPNKLHLYLLSYQRHCLVGHFVLQTDEKK